MIDRLRDVRARAQRRTSNLYDTLFTRNVSPFITAALLGFRVAPNAVSVVALLVGVASCVLIATARLNFLLIGIGLLHLHQVLDSVDGELARAQRRFSLQGLFLEDLSAYLLINGYYLSIGTYLWVFTGSSTPLWAAGLVVAFGRNAMPVARRVVLRQATQHLEPAEPTPQSTASPEPSAAKAALRVLRAAVEDHLLHYTNVRVVLTTVLIVERLGWSEHILLPAILACYLLLQMLKEVGTAGLFLFTDALDKHIQTLRGIDAGHRGR